MGTGPIFNHLPTNGLFETHPTWCCVRVRAGTGKFYASCLFSNSFLSPTPSGNDREEEARPSGAVGRSGKEKVLDSDSTWEA